MSLPSMQSVCTKPRVVKRLILHGNYTRLSFAICYLTRTLKENTVIFRYMLHLFVRGHIFLAPPLHKK